MATELSFARGTALYVAAVLGPGILTLPALAANLAGPLFLLPLVLILGLSALLAAVFTALGRRSGSAADVGHYVQQAFGTTAGTVTRALFYIGVPPGVTALGLFGGSYLHAALGGRWTPQLVALVLLVATFLLNRAGLRASASLQLVLTSVLVLLLVVTVATAAPHVSSARFTPFAPHGWAAIGPAAFVLVWVLTGWEASANLYAALNPRSVVRVAVAAVLIIAAAFIGVAVAVVGVLGADSISAAPVADLLEEGLGPAGLVVAVALAIVLTLGNMNTYVASLGAIGQRMSPFLTSTAAGRQLWVPTGIAFVSLLVTWGRTDAPTVLVEVTAASQVPVLLLTCLAGARLLKRWSSVWWASCAASLAVTVLLTQAGGFLVVPAVIAVATYGWTVASASGRQPAWLGRWPPRSPRRCPRRRPRVGGVRR